VEAPEGRLQRGTFRASPEDGIAFLIMCSGPASALPAPIAASEMAPSPALLKLRRVIFMACTPRFAGFNYAPRCIDVHDAGTIVSPAM
jgi:hypothetical protein